MYFCTLNDNVLQYTQQTNMFKTRNKKGEPLKKRPSALLSLLPVAVLVAMLTATIRAFGSDALDDLRR